MITIIAAASDNNVIGKNNDLIWHLPDDFKRFKELTTGNHILMGRKTFESFPKPLPNRTHIIITRQESYNVPDNCFTFKGVHDALDEILEFNDKDIWIIGGGEIYEQTMEIADKIELTRVHSNFEGDTYFPEIDYTKWRLVNEEFHDRDSKHQYSFTYQTFERI